MLKGKIKSVRYINSEDFVYDISVHNNHNFIANNIVVSNCHHIPANTTSQISQWCKNAYYRIGVSATPWRDAGDDLLIEAILNKRKPENSINASKLIELGYLVPPTIYFVPIKESFKGKNYHQVYSNAIVNNTIRNETIIKIACKMRQTRDAKILILIQRVEHGEIIQKMLFEKIKQETFSMTVKDPKNGKDTLVRVKNIEFLSGQDDPVRRKAVIEAVKQQKCQILIGSTIADEGLDISCLDTLILAGGGRSSTRAFQRIGRVIRLFKDPLTGKKKTRAIVFDFQDATPMLRRHSRVREKLYRTEDLWDIKLMNMKLLEDD